MINRWKDIIVKNLRVKFRVHASLNLAHVTDTVGGEAAPDHEGSATELDGWLYVTRLKSLTTLPPAPLATV
jgi:hypothetical protein